MGTSAPHECYDLVGIGFGPAGLCLAVALDERDGRTPGGPVAAVFLERRPAAERPHAPRRPLGLSCLKDLAAARGPASRFGFVSYLHDAGRLAEFVDGLDGLDIRRPCHEFHRYLEWTEAKVAGRVRYESAVVGVAPPAGADPIEHLLVRVRDRAGVRVIATRAVAAGRRALGPTGPLAALGRFAVRDGAGRPRIDRNHRLVTTGALRCAVHVLDDGGRGGAAALSNLAVRGGEIADAVARGNVAVVGHAG